MAATCSGAFLMKFQLLRLALARAVVFIVIVIVVDVDIDVVVRYDSDRLLAAPPMNFSSTNMFAIFFAIHRTVTHTVVAFNYCFHKPIG
jgi:hypothetical protein